MKLTFFSALLPLTMHAQAQHIQPISGYATIGPLRMYYEIHGKGQPLILIHGGGSTIGTSFGQVIDSFAQHRKVIAVGLQAHGHAADIDRPLTQQSGPSGPPPWWSSATRTSQDRSTP